MTDRLTPSRRSWNMSRIPSKNTKTELVVRSLVHSIGYRYRLHRKDLPGKPDMVFSKYRTVIFIHGCFWHRHKGCKITTTPKTNTEFWKKKFNRNIALDAEHQQKLLEAGWKVTVVWQCELKDLNKLAARISAYLTLTTDIYNQADLPLKKEPFHT